MIRLFDTQTRQVKELALRQPGKLSLYVCGPTVYSHPHIGHGRSALIFDTLRRYLEWSGLEVIHVSNVTDIDDKIIGKAQTEGRTEAEVAEEWEAVYWDALDRLGVLRPHHTPHATEYVKEMVALIGELVDTHGAYITSDGVYLEVGKLAEYGVLVNQSLESLEQGARVDVNEEKRSSADFALWKFAKHGEPAWPSPWGDGRPGWHTECVVMSLDILGEAFDLHGGGLDLCFPHHENERAQATGLGKRFAQHWMHHGFVEIDGEKMSKSLGNFTTLNDLLDAFDPRSYRLLLLQSHYRAPIEVTKETIAAAVQSLSRFDEVARRAQPLANKAVDQDALARFVAAMDDDLDTPTAIAVAFDTVRRVNRALDDGDDDAAAASFGALKRMLHAVGLEVGGEVEVDDESANMVAARNLARLARDWSKADELRAALESKGWVVEDSPEGTRIHQ